jgi:hypothetical protein
MPLDAQNFLFGFAESLVYQGEKRSWPANVPTTKNQADPQLPCGGPRMNPLFTVGTSRDPLGISAWRSIAHRIVTSPVPVHSALVQKSVAAITNPAGRLSGWMLGQARAYGKRTASKSWQLACLDVPRGDARLLSCLTPFFQHFVQRVRQLARPFEVFHRAAVLVAP